MPVVIPLVECIARPNQPRGDLVRHSEAVARGCGAPAGTFEDRLAFVAGLCHDLAKSAADWQLYIRSKCDGYTGPRIERGPPHAPLGAALFAFWADQLTSTWIPSRRGRESMHDLALDWVRMVYRHHGRLDDLDRVPPWCDSAAAEEHDPARLLLTCDRAGLDALVRRHFPEYAGSLGSFDSWYQGFDRLWGYRVGTGRPNLIPADESGRDRLAVRLTALGARLIFADRRDAAEWVPDCFTPEQATAAITRHTEACAAAAAKAREAGASEDLVRARHRLQDEALARYREHREQSVFTLLLPTGYGKTLTGLRVALEAAASGRCSRLVYVAPYISILSQSAEVIREATGLDVFLYHHLSILGDARHGRPEDDTQREDHQRYDLLDTWQTPVVATTFNQLFRALFPSRAQECLRIPALDRAFVFIDEPQIVDPNVWSAFLRAASLAARDRGCQVLFATATLPRLGDGLGAEVAPVALAENVTPAVSRYVITTNSTALNATAVRDEALGRFRKTHSVAVILNTVRDAVDVHDRITAADRPDWFFLAAMMLPGHKARRIAEVRGRLDPSNPGHRPTGVVCTQVLEAGVDLSFRSLLRATPIFSSVAQSAGRANRHGEGDPAEVVVFPFVREDGRDSRGFVYRDRTFVGKTDEVLKAHPVIPESGLGDALKRYYDSSWAENARLESLGRFAEAAGGKWSSLAGQEPFGGDYPRIDVLVPGAERYLADHHRGVLAAFGATTAQSLLDRYAARSLPPGPPGESEFIRRKRLSALLQQFVVAVPAKVAVRIADPVLDAFGNELWVWRLTDPAAYSERTGLAHHLTPVEESPDGCMIF